MINYIFTLLGVAFITYIIELPIIAIGFNKIIPFNYLNIITLLVNFLTNILLNGFAIPITSFYMANLSTDLVIIILEIIIVIAEYFLYKIAFDKFATDKLFKRKLLLKTATANVCSFSLGILINIFL